MFCSQLNVMYGRLGLSQPHTNNGTILYIFLHLCLCLHLLYKLFTMPCFLECAKISCVYTVWSEKL